MVPEFADYLWPVTAAAVTVTLRLPVSFLIIIMVPVVLMSGAPPVNAGFSMKHIYVDDNIWLHQFRSNPAPFTFLVQCGTQSWGLPRTSFRLKLPAHGDGSRPRSQQQHSIQPPGRIYDGGCYGVLTQQSRVLVGAFSMVGMTPRPSVGPQNLALYAHRTSFSMGCG